MRVALDVTPLAGARTGIGLFAAAMVEEFADPDHRVELVGLAMTARGRDEIATALHDAGATLGRAAPARLLRAAWGRIDLPPVEWLTGPVDVVHGTNYVVPPARRAAQLVSVHDLSAWRDPEQVTPTSRAYPRLVERALARGAHLHTISGFVADEIEADLGVSRDRIHTVHLAADTLPPAEPGAGLRQVAADRPDDRRAVAERFVLAVGSVEPRKDYPRLVAAFDAIATDRPDLALAIAGGPGWGSEALADAIAASAHGERIRLLGHVTAEEKASLLHDAAVVVSSATYEGFGIVPLEAMAAGSPVVAVAGGSVPEVCADAAVLVPPSDNDALAAAMAAVLDDGAAAAGLVAAGRRRAERFSWASTARGLVDVYRSLVDP